MPRQTKNETVRCRHFRWILRRRGGVFVADGRGNDPPLGRHSLSVRDRREALERLDQLDRIKAVELGLVEPTENSQTPATKLKLADGWCHYKAHLERPEIAGGVCKKSLQRYTAVFEKFHAYAQSKSVSFWNDVTVHVLQGYLRNLERRKFAERSQYLEGNTLKQIMRWLTNENLLPHTCLFKLPLRKPHGTSTYCYRENEIGAMIEHCQSTNGLAWLADVLLALACTGMRISELATLRWSDIDFDRGVVRITNDQTRDPKTGSRRRTKNRRDRSVPLHAELIAVLKRLVRTHDGLVFHGPLGGRIKPDTIRNILVRKVIKPLKTRFPTPAGAIGFEHGRLHSFRHAFCSTAANKGIPEATVMKWLGHQSSEITKIYYHLNDSAAREMMTRVSFVKLDDSRTGDATSSPMELTTA